MAEMNTNTAELLQQMIDIKRDMRTAIGNKGVTVVSGMESYPSAIDSIRTGNIVIEDGGVDYTQIGWTIDDTIAQNEVDRTIVDIDIEFSKTVMEYFKDGFNVAYNQSDGALWDTLYPNIVYMPIVNSTSQTDFSSLFGGYINTTTHPKLRVFPSIDTSNAVDMHNMFAYCTALDSVGLLECSKVDNIGGIFMYCNNLKHLGGFTNLGRNLNGSIGSAADAVLDIRWANQLTTTSVLNVFNTIANVSTVKKCTIWLHPDVLNKLSADDIAIATSKGWTITK